MPEPRLPSARRRPASIMMNVFAVTVAVTGKAPGPGAPAAFDLCSGPSSPTGAAAPETRALYLAHFHWNYSHE